MQYRVPRFPCDHPVTGLGRTGSFEGRLTNISRAGARLTGVAQLRRGDLLRLDLGADQLPRMAEVRWVIGTNVGLRFAQPLDARAVAVIRKAPALAEASTGQAWNLHLREMQ